MKLINNVEHIIQFENELNKLQSNENCDLIYITNSYLYEKLFEKLLKQEDAFLKNSFQSFTRILLNKIDLNFLLDNGRLLLCYRFKSPYLAGLFLINEYENYINMCKICENANICSSKKIECIRVCSKQLSFKCRVHEEQIKLVSLRSNGILQRQCIYLTPTKKSKYFA